MSKSLYWSRVPVEIVEIGVDSLRYALVKKLWGSDGSEGEGWVTVDKTIIPFLEGILIGNGSGDMGRDASNLIDAINKYGQIRLCIH